MLEVAMDPASKKLSLDVESVANLSENDRKDAQHTVELVNRLMRDFVACDGNIPPPPTQLTAKISQTASQLARNGMQALRSGKPADAITLLSTALEAVQRRPLWEGVATTIEETCLCLGPRCDAYAANNQWAEAYADASLLLLMKPGDAANYFRKAVPLMAIQQYGAARQLLQTALSIKDNETLFHQALKIVNTLDPEQ